MGLGANQVWANGITIAAPSVGKISSGFACGDADPDLFNYILKEYGEAIFDNQQEMLLNKSITDNFEQSQSGVNDGFVQSFSELFSRTQQATTSTLGIVELSTFLDMVINNGNTTQAITPDAFHQFMRLYSNYRMYSDNNSHWDVYLSGGNDQTFTRNSGVLFNNKGQYVGALNISTAAGLIQVGFNFDLFWNELSASPDIIHRRLILPVKTTTGTMVVHLDIECETGQSADLTLTVTNDAGTTDPNIQIATLQKSVTNGDIEEFSAFNLP